jgi:flagellar hook assembly protein FlgD
LEQKATPVTPRLPTPLPTLAANPLTVQAQAQTIVFQEWPANIYVSFEDGVGVYRLEVLDASLRHLRSLYEKKVVGQKEDWVEWDGKDDEGKNVPKGEYTVLFTKDGNLLTQMIMLREEAP